MENEFTVYSKNTLRLAIKLVEDLTEKFESKFLKRDDDYCWEWLAHKNNKGYGNFRFDGQMRGAHRVSYQIYIGEIPDQLHVLHKCDNPSCVNPKHLFLGTNLDNVNDKVTKGRGPSLVGEKNPRAKLTLTEVGIIKDAIKNKFTHKKIAGYFKISTGTVSAISTGQNWSL